MVTKRSTTKSPKAGTAAARAARAGTRAARAASATPKETGPEVIGTGALKKRELIDRVVRCSGVKKKDAKPVVEALLSVLGESLTEGRELNLQPLGKVKVNRVKEAANGKVLVTRIRQPGPALQELRQDAEAEGEISSISPLAEDGEDR